jgi:hypothetical protein
MICYSVSTRRANAGVELAVAPACLSDIGITITSKAQVGSRLNQKHKTALILLKRYLLVALRGSFRDGHFVPNDLRKYCE